MLCYVVKFHQPNKKCHCNLSISKQVLPLKFVEEDKCDSALYTIISNGIETLWKSFRDVTFSTSLKFLDFIDGRTMMMFNCLMTRSINCIKPEWRKNSVAKKNLQLMQTCSVFVKGYEASVVVN